MASICLWRSLPLPFYDLSPNCCSFYAQVICLKQTLCLDHVWFYQIFRYFFIAILNIFYCNLFNLLLQCKFSVFAERCWTLFSFKLFRESSDEDWELLPAQKQIRGPRMYVNIGKYLNICMYLNICQFLKCLRTLKVDKLCQNYR